MCRNYVLRKAETSLIIDVTFLCFRAQPAHVATRSWFLRVSIEAGPTKEWLCVAWTRVVGDKTYKLVYYW